MLAEWLTHVTTPCRSAFRDFGYLGELIAIKHRHKRCRAAWRPHLEACKSFITKASEQSAGTGTAVVLGSGQLLDIPVDHLARRFQKVFLVDVCHLRDSRRIARRHTNITLVEADISGTVDELMSWSQGDPLPEPEPSLDMLPDADYVVSANLLAQLPLAPLHHLEKRAPGLGETARQAYGARIIGRHLALLQALDCPVTLISETRHIIADGDHVLEESDPLYGHRLPPADMEWQWELAPRPELAPDFDLRLQIAAIARLPARG